MHGVQSFKRMILQGVITQSVDYHLRCLSCFNKKVAFLNSIHIVFRNSIEIVHCFGIHFYVNETNYGMTI